MSSDKVSAWLKLSTFLGRGTRYLSAYAAWRARRLASSILVREGAWPGDEDLKLALPLDSSSPRFASALRSHFSSREGPALSRWSRRAEIVSLVPEGLREETIQEADRILGRRFSHRGREVSFARAIDWSHAPGGNLDWTWDLNRHHFFVKLGRAYWYTEDEKYAKGFVELLLDWTRSSPPGVEEPAWRSVFEVGVRLSNWCWAHQLFLPSRSLSDREHLDVVRGILAMGRFLEKHIERHAWNNHLLLEAKALAMTGLLYPEFCESARWRKEGSRLFEGQLARQLCSDGVHGERSTLYQRIITSELLELLVVMRLAGREDEGLAAREALRRMASFLAAITRADGSMPLLNDSSRHDEHVRFDPVAGAGAFLEDGALLEVASRDEGVIWLLEAAGMGERALRAAAAHPPSARSSIAFPSGGYWVLRADEKDQLHMVFDCGPFGDAVVPGHGHADALSIDLAVGRRHVLVDPGMYSAHLGARWRNFFRGTAAHNTVVVDGKDQSILKGLRKVYRPARARCVEWLSCGAFDIVAGEHDGYRRLDRPITHRREIFFRKPRYVLVVDQLEGEGSHAYDFLFHLHPALEPALDAASCSVLALDEEGVGLAILPLETQGLQMALVEGEEGEDGDDGKPPQGWVAFDSGSKEPSPVVCYHREGPAPCRSGAVLVPLFSSASSRPALKEVPVVPAELEAVAGKLSLERGREETFLLRRLGEPPSPGSFLRAGDLETDAEAAALGVGAGGEVESGVLHKGTELRWNGEVALRLEGRAPGSLGFSLDKDKRRLDLSVEGALSPALGRGVMFFLSASIEAVFLDGSKLSFERKEGGVLLGA